MQNRIRKKENKMNDQQLLETLAAEYARLKSDKNARPERVAALLNVINVTTDRLNKN